MINIFINGETKAAPGEVSLHRLLELFSLPSRQIAIELNREVVRRKDWENIIVRENDRIEIVHFVGGG